MRKIEQQMTDAIYFGYSWQSGNTRVEVNRAGAAVYLHGNNIAIIDPDKRIWVHHETIRKWPTATTMSRLRALGVDAQIKNHKPMIDGREI